MRDGEVKTYKLYYARIDEDDGLYFRASDLPAARAMSRSISKSFFHGRKGIKTREISVGEFNDLKDKMGEDDYYGMVSGSIIHYVEDSYTPLLK